MDDDVSADAGWLDGLLDAAVAYADAGCITGLVLPLELETDAQILFEKGGGFRKGFQRAVYRPFSEGKPFYPCFPGLFGTGANMAVRRNVVRELGGFDDALDTGAPLPGGGDLDMFYQTIRAGYTLVYEPSALVFHRHRRKMKELRLQYWSWVSVSCLLRQNPIAPTLRRGVIFGEWSKANSRERFFSSSKVCGDRMVFLRHFPWRSFGVPWLAGWEGMTVRFAVLKRSGGDTRETLADSPRGPPKTNPFALSGEGQGGSLCRFLVPRAAARSKDSCFFRAAVSSRGLCDEAIRSILPA